jgi:hypothetical protein
MTDREPKARPDHNPQPGEARNAFPPGGPNANAHPELASRGDGPPMSLTLAPRSHPRTHAPDGHADAVRSWLERLHGEVEAPPAFAPLALPHADRSPAEVELLARAAACPDLFVVHAPDHTAGERVIADLARLTAPERTLVLSPNPAAADRIVERLTRPGRASPAVEVVRALAEDENPVRPSSVVSRLTSAAYPAARAERLSREADGVVAAADARLTAIEKLGELADRAAALDPRVAEVVARRDAVEAEVRDEAAGKSVTAFATLIERRQAEAAAVAAELVKERIALEERRRADETALADARRRLAEAAPDSGKKSGFFGRLFNRARHDPNPAELETQIRELESEIAALDARLGEVRAKLESQAAANAAERQRLIGEEVAARRSRLEAELAEPRGERERLRAEVAKLAAGLALASATAEELSAARHAATRALVEARDRSAEVRRPDSDAARLLAGVPVVVGTPGSLHADRVFARDPGNSGPPPFDLLVLDRAEELTETDFVQLARLARRWVLVGDVLPADDPPRSHLNGSPSRHVPGRNGRPVEPPFAARLARLLDRRRWAAEGNWLVCRLAHPDPARRSGMTREPLLDCPEIEVRFVAGDDGELVLAEVAFPAAMPVGEAKAFLFRHLGEVLLRPCGPATWHEEAGTLTARWPAAERGEGEWIDLEPGVREKVVGFGLSAFTAAVSFAAAAGWDAEKAAAWLEGHLEPSACRFATAPRPPRP